MEIFWKSK